MVHMIVVILVVVILMAMEVVMVLMVRVASWLKYPIIPNKGRTLYSRKKNCPASFLFDVRPLYSNSFIFGAFGAPIIFQIFF